MMVLKIIRKKSKRRERGAGKRGNEGGRAEERGRGIRPTPNLGLTVRINFSFWKREKNKKFTIEHILFFRFHL